MFESSTTAVLKRSTSIFATGSNGYWQFNTGKIEGNRPKCQHYAFGLTIFVRIGDRKLAWHYFFYPFYKGWQNLRTCCNRALFLHI